MSKIVISGAGPTGLSIALLAARAGIDVTVLEKRGSVNLESKASTFHAPTLELLDRLGLLEQMLATGVRVDHVQYRDSEGHVLARMGFAALKDVTKCAFRLHYEQAALSQRLCELLKEEASAEIVFGAEVVSFAESAEGVEVAYAHGGKPVTITADFLFGCDGAQSAVREAARIGYREKPYPGMVLRLYASKALPEILGDVDGITYIFNGDDSVSLLEMPDCWRIIVRVPDGVDEATAKSDEWIVGRLKYLLPIEKILPGVIKRDTYSPRKRETLQSRTNRVFLAGDAVHLTNTRGGMNLNAGVHDAFALAQGLIRTVADGKLEHLHSASDARARVSRDVLLPRTDQNVGTGRERVARIIETSKDAAKTKDYLARQAMLDMLDGIDRAVAPSEAVHG